MHGASAIQLFLQVIQLPSQEEANHIAGEIYHQTGFPYVQGLIDGTHIEIQKPTSKDYVNINQSCH